MQNSGDTRLLSPDEKNQLRQLGSSIGCSAIDEQLASLSRFREIFTTAGELARQDRTQRSKMYTSCSILIGMLTAIIII